MEKIQNKMCRKRERKEKTSSNRSKKVSRRKNEAKTFKYFKYENDLFILLDANLHNWNIIGDQLQMLKNLNSGENEYNNVFIFSHQVIWIDTENKKFSGLITNSKEGKAKKLNFWNEVFPVINDIGEKVFLFAATVKKHLTRLTNCSVIHNFGQRHLAYLLKNGSMALRSASLP